ncbi:MAG: c-type cytochrome [Acidobacteriota bacterium]|nr:c-type cytochrome [Acidobacteriota bacterium]
MRIRSGWTFTLARGAVVLPVVVLLACAVEEPVAVETSPDDELFARASQVFAPLPETAASPDNELTQVKVDLGQRLYFDPQLSKRGNVSCDSCHSLATFGVDNEPTSEGDAGDRGERNAPTVLNAALHVAQFWDGRAPDVEAQATMPILNPVEMAIPSEEFLVERLSAIDGYREMFAAAFPGADGGLTFANVGRALGAFERTLMTYSRFDQYLQGDREALTADEKAGLELFLKLGCGACHNGVTAGGQAFRKFGLNESYWVHTKSGTIDEGRAGITGDDADRYYFKIASLRNVAETAPYFHDGSVESLPEALTIMARVQIGAELTDRQADQMAAFLGSLTGELPETTRDAAGTGG